MNKNALVLGATGLIGYGVASALNETGWKVRAVSKRSLINTHIFSENIEYVSGDFYDEKFLKRALIGIDKVFFFLSSTFPSTSLHSLEFEISRTISGLDYLLRMMKELNVPEIVFPSSGGTIYGSVTTGGAKESDTIKPVTPYGMGKKICEEVLDFYSLQGISSTILRVGNVYGSPFARTTTQGVIDVFVQKAISGEEATVWGDSLTNIRDYIFLDDFSYAVASIADYKAKGVEVYNLSSGIGTSLEDIIIYINKYSEKPLKVKYISNDSTASIKRIVLDMEKFKKKTGWYNRFSIENGIAETIERKKQMQLML